MRSASESMAALLARRPAASALALGVLPPVAPAGKAVDRVYLLAPVSQGEALAEEYGIECNKHGANFSLESDVNLAAIPQGLLPLFARAELAPFLADLPPTDSWGGSLASVLLTSSLQPYADAALRRFSHKCYFCGAPKLSDKVPAHAPWAWWRYYEPAPGEPFARQHLLAFTPACRDCTDMFALGVDDAGRQEALLGRLAIAFRFDEAESRQYLQILLERRARHASHIWAVDGSRVFGDHAVEVQAAWDHRGEPDIEYPILHRPAAAGGRSASLILCGVHYTLHNSPRDHFYR